MNLMIGTNPSGKGGVASVVAVLQKEGFLRDQEIAYLASHTAGSRWNKLTGGAAALGRVFVFCASKRPNIVHVHSASRASFVRKSVALAIARIFGARTIFHLHGGGFKRFAVDESGALMRWWIRRTLERSSRVIALSDSWASFLRDYAPQAQIDVVPNSVMMPIMPSPETVEPERVLFLGRAEKGKGIFELLAAVAALHAEFPSLKLAIGGDGNLDAVRTRAHELGIVDRVEILGWIGPEQKQSELARASVFTLPSYNEGLPMAMLEAMAAGKAIVVTSVGGIPEAVIDGDNGLLVAPKDVTALAAALRLILADSVLRKALAKRARATVAQRFSTDVVMGKLRALYAELQSIDLPSH